MPTGQTLVPQPIAVSTIMSMQEPLVGLAAEHQCRVFETSTGHHGLVTSLFQLWA